MSTPEDPKRPTLEEWNAAKAREDAGTRTDADWALLEGPLPLELQQEADAESKRIIDEARAAGKAKRQQTRRSSQDEEEFADAVARFNTQHAAEWPSYGGTCPACGHEGCFGVNPLCEGQWSCSNVSHGDTKCGHRSQGGSCYVGDALDLAAHAHGLSPVELLRQEGYLKPRQSREEPPPPTDADAPPEIRGLRVIDGGNAPQAAAKPARSGRSAAKRPGGGGAATAPAATPSDRPEIHIRVEENVVIDQAVAALVSDERVFRRGGKLVHVVRDWRKPLGASGEVMMPRILPITPPLGREILAQRAEWLKYDGKDWINAHPPDWAVRGVFARDEWPGRTLAAISETPLLTADGEILTQRGYDPKTGVYLDPNVELAPMPERPTQDDAKNAAADLLDVIADFPIPTEFHQSAWVAGVLSPLARFAFDGPVPIITVDANVPGAGKTLLVQLIANIVTGSDTETLAYSEDDEEVEKLILTLAESGERLALFDNVATPIGCPSLDRALTTTVVKGRRLRENQLIRAPMHAIWFATGNNIMLKGDLGRRTLHIRLESPLEKPEERTDFKHKPLMPWVIKERPRLLAAAFTILRAYCLAGWPSQNLPNWGGFDAWSRLVRDALVWTGLPDPGETRQFREHADQDVSLLGALLKGWRTLAGDTGLSVGDALKALGSRPDDYRGLVEAVLEFCPGPGGDLPSVRQLANRLKRFKGRVHQNMCLDSRESHGGVSLWYVRKAL